MQRAVAAKAEAWGSSCMQIKAHDSTKNRCKRGGAVVQPNLGRKERERGGGSRREYAQDCGGREGWAEREREGGGGDDNVCVRRIYVCASCKNCRCKRYELLRNGMSAACGLPGVCWWCFTLWASYLGTASHDHTFCCVAASRRCICSAI